jgi:hypothetical protein
VGLFPKQTDLAGLAPSEYEALRSLGRACVQLRTEVELADAAHSRVCRSMEDAGDTEPDPAFTPLSNVLDALSDSTYQQARHAGELCYTHTAAYTVLGIAILDRLTSDRPPLTVEHLVELSGEPTLGQLRDALQIPVAQLLRWPANPVSVRDATEGRQDVLAELDSIERSLRDPMAMGPDVTEYWMAAAKVSTDSSPGVDPLWDRVTEMLERVADQTPYEIASYLARTSAGRAVEAGAAD